MGSQRVGHNGMTFTFTVVNKNVRPKEWCVQKQILRNSLAVLPVRTPCFHCQGPRFHSLVKGLRSHKPMMQPSNNNKNPDPGREGFNYK